MVTRNQHRDGIRENWKCGLICIGMAFAMAQYGIDVAAVGTFQSMPGFLMTFGYPDPNLNGGWGISTTDQQLITSFLNVGTIISVLFITPFSRFFGRRHGIWMGCILSFASCAVQMVSTSISSLCVGRALMGASNAFFITFCNTYIVECAPASLRAICSAMFAITMNIGTMIGAIVDEQTSHMMSKLAYQIPLACLFIFPTFLSIFMFFIPESPRWLMLHDRREEAERSLAFLRDDTLESKFIQEEIVEIIRGVEEEKANASSASIVDIFKGTNLRRTLICLSVVVSRASSGIWVFPQGILLPAGWPRRRIQDWNLYDDNRVCQCRDRSILRIQGLRPAYYASDRDRRCGDIDARRGHRSYDRTRYTGIRKNLPRIQLLLYHCLWRFRSLDDVAYIRRGRKFALACGYLVLCYWRGLHLRL